MRISDWSSDVCSSDLLKRPRTGNVEVAVDDVPTGRNHRNISIVAVDDEIGCAHGAACNDVTPSSHAQRASADIPVQQGAPTSRIKAEHFTTAQADDIAPDSIDLHRKSIKSEEHTTELQSLMRISCAAFRVNK